MKLPRYRTGNADLDRLVAELVEHADTDDENRDVIFEMLAAGVRLARDRTDRGDLKIASAALREMRDTFHLFAPYRAGRKVAMFGSARTQPDDPLYDQARRFAAAIAARDWMVITGAGPGIMEAGIEGAGPERAFGVSIRLPFEATSSQLIADDPKLLSFRYFFTRKLAFIKESDGFVLLPGGFGTLDEAFELLTLMQTGKTQPAPIVLLDIPGGTYWVRWRDFLEREMMPRGYISDGDLTLVHTTDDADAAVEEIVSFYDNYQSQRFVQGRLVLRVRRAPDDAALAALSEEFASIITRGAIERIDASDEEATDEDRHLDRIALWFDRFGWAEVRQLIHRLNEVTPG